MSHPCWWGSPPPRRPRKKYEKPSSGLRVCSEYSCERAGVALHSDAVLSNGDTNETAFYLAGPPNRVLGATTMAPSAGSWHVQWIAPPERHESFFVYLTTHGITNGCIEPDLEPNLEIPGNP